MAKEYYAQFNIEEVQYFLDFIKNNIAQYRLSEFTNGVMGDVPSINAAHPLAMEFGALLSSSDPDNYSSILPAIGVELLHDKPFEKDTLGRGYKVEEVYHLCSNTWKS